MSVNRRKLLKTTAIATAGLAAAPLISGCNNDKRNGSKGQSQQTTVGQDYPELKKYSAKVKTLVNNTACIDMLGTYGNWFENRDGLPLADLWGKVPNSFTEDDYLFVRSCGIDVFGWGRMHPTYDGMLQFMATQNGIIASNPKYFERIDTQERLKNINNSGKIGMLITNQDSQHFRTLEDIDLFYALGQRLSQITYNDQNKLGCGAFVDTDTGLTPYGRQVVGRMNEIGMAIDVSHCGDQTTMDTIAVSTQPVLITHGACRAIAKGVARAKTDEAIKAMANTGGVIGIPILRFMIREVEPVHFSDFISHIDHVAQLVGVDHVGIGSDQGLYTEDYGQFAWRKMRLDNAPAKYQTHTNEEYLLTIEGLNHPYRTYDIADGLIKKGYSDGDVQKVLGHNFQRVLIDIFKH